MANFITRNIPNTLTCGNLVSGCIATVMALGGDARYALIWIIIGAVFDFFDGMSARLFGVSSPIGKELDSLADDVTFGVAPSARVFAQLSVMEYPTVLASVEPYIPYCAFLIAAFSALRLAKFNLDTRQTLLCRIRIFSRSPPPLHITVSPSVHYIQSAAFALLYFFSHSFISFASL